MIFFIKILSIRDRIKVIQIKGKKTESIENFSQNRLSVVSQFDKEDFFTKKQFGTINLENALKESVVKKKEKKSIQKSILLIIDKPYYSLNFFYPQLKKYFYQANAYHIPIYILYIGQKFSSDYFLDLKKIIKITNGKFFFYNGVQDLEKAYGEITKQKKNIYSVTYLSSIQNRDIGKFRKVNVKVKYRGRNSNDFDIGYLIPWRFKFFNQK